MMTSLSIFGQSCKNKMNVMVISLIILCLQSTMGLYLRTKTLAPIFFHEALIRGNISSNIQGFLLLHFAVTFFEDTTTSLVYGSVPPTCFDALPCLYKAL